jgi:cytidine deaminase
MGAIGGERLERLRAFAEAARARSYAQYSNFVVVAAVETVDGGLYGGANVEIANYSLTKHAEEVAVLAAIGAGQGPRGSWVTALYVGGGPPCGGCRQFVAEFAAADAICAFEPLDRSTPPIVRRLSELLPEPFTLEPGVTPV